MNSGYCFDCKQGWEKQAAKLHTQRPCTTVCLCAKFGITSCSPEFTHPQVLAGLPCLLHLFQLSLSPLPESHNTLFMWALESWQSNLPSPSKVQSTTNKQQNYSNSRCQGHDHQSEEGTVQHIENSASTKSRNDVDSHDQCSVASYCHVCTLKPVFSFNTFLTVFDDSACRQTEIT